MERTKLKLSLLPRGSKSWWKISQTLMMRTQENTSIPPLKNEEGKWVLSVGEKANLFADTFHAKSTLPEAQENEYSPIPVCDSKMSGFLPIRQRNAEYVLKHLDESSATGPDNLPSRILKTCWKSLALPTVLLGRCILRYGVWPRFWCTHWIFPLHKKRTKSNAGNYRGIHLTPQISKVMERLVGKLFLPFLEKSGAFGSNQFAYRKQRSFMDVLAWNVLYWITAFQKNQRVGLYCSDVSAAFDRVSASRLLQKLTAKGVHPHVLEVLWSWLQNRPSVVIVGNAKSSERELSNSVFQGTVWGPPLWNTYFEDAHQAVRKEHFVETVFADDLNCFKCYNQSIGDEKIFEELQIRQQGLHQWGEANQVTFDAGKESFHILHPRVPSGTNFKMLGVNFDVKLVMQSACYGVAGIAADRCRAVLKLRRFFSTAELVNQYKSQVLSGIDFTTPAIYHAPEFFLRAIDEVQDNFLRELHLSQSEAFVQFNLAPLSLRRDISMLGLLHRIVLSEAPPQFSQFIYPASSREFLRGWAYTFSRHNRQLHDPLSYTSLRIMHRSIFRLIHPYNALPQEIVDLKTVKSFQKRLHVAIKECAREGIPNWESFLREGIRVRGIAFFRNLFN